MKPEDEKRLWQLKRKIAADMAVPADYTEYRRLNVQRKMAGVREEK